MDITAISPLVYLGLMREKGADCFDEYLGPLFGADFDGTVLLVALDADGKCNVPLLNFRGGLWHYQGMTFAHMRICPEGTFSSREKIEKLQTMIGIRPIRATT